MSQQISIVLVPADDTPPDPVVAALEQHLTRIAGSAGLETWMDICGGLGGVDLVVRATFALSGTSTPESIERALSAELGRRHLESAVFVRSEAAHAAPIPGAEREPRSRASPPPVVRPSPEGASDVRDEVRRLMHLVPRGRVTTVTALASWIATTPERVAGAYDGLAAEPRLPWWRVTDRDGRLDTLGRGGRLRAQTARLEGEGVPVRRGGVVGFRRYVIDVRALGLGSAASGRGARPPGTTC